MGSIQQQRVQGCRSATSDPRCSPRMVEAREKGALPSPQSVMQTQPGRPLRSSDTPLRTPALTMMLGQGRGGELSTWSWDLQSAGRISFCPYEHSKKPPSHVPITSLPPVALRSNCVICNF